MIKSEESIQSLNTIPNLPEGERLSLGNGKNLKIKYHEIEDRSTQRGKIIHDAIVPNIDPYLLGREVVDIYNKIVDLSHRELIALYDKNPNSFIDFQNILKRDKKRRGDLVSDIKEIFSGVEKNIIEPEESEDAIVHHFYHDSQKKCYTYNINNLEKIKKWLLKIEKNQQKISAGEIWTHSSGVKYEIMDLSEGHYYDVEDYEVNKKIEGPLHVKEIDKNKIYYTQLEDGAVMKKGTKYFRSKTNFLDNFNNTK